MLNKILILSADVGKSWRSTAEALAEQFAAMNVTADIADALTLVPQNSATLARWRKSYAYHNLSRREGTAYRSEALYAGKKLYRLCALGANALSEFLGKGEYDAVLCIHVFAGMMMTEVRKKTGAQIPFYFLATEYMGEPGIDEVRADKYLIPHRMLLGDFIRFDISADKLLAVGIPVSPRFFAEHADRATLRKELGLPEDGPLVLVRAGNFEHRKTASRILSLLSALPEDVSVAVLCGTNERLLHQLSRASGQGRLFPFGYDTSPEKLLYASDLCIGKPRGVATTETMSCGVPLVLFREVRGAESKNLEFLVHCGVADGSRSWREIIRIVLRLLSDETERETRSEAVRAFLPRNGAAEQICRIICRNKLAAQPPQ